MEKLKNILKSFDVKRSVVLANKKDGCFLNDKESENLIAECFQPIAKYVLNKGYFCIGDEYCIGLRAVELYYNEEGDGLFKDPIMYHTDARTPEYLSKGGFKYDYFKFGSLNLHTSGVDVTFEKENEYRASFLIREFEVFKWENGKKVTLVADEKCSTFIFDYMFPKGISTETLGQISWKEYKPGQEAGTDDPEPSSRQGVCKYEKEGNIYKYDDEKKRYKKLEKTKCHRQWRFRRK